MFVPAPCWKQFRKWKLLEVCLADLHPLYKSNMESKQCVWKMISPVDLAMLGLVSMSNWCTSIPKNHGNKNCAANDQTLSQVCADIGNIKNIRRTTSANALPWDVNYNYFQCGNGQTQSHLAAVHSLVALKWVAKQETDSSKQSPELSPNSHQNYG